MHIVLMLFLTTSKIARSLMPRMAITNRIVTPVSLMTLRALSSDVYIGNLPVHLPEEVVIGALKERVGEKHSAFKFMVDRVSGKSRGFAYLKYEEEAHAIDAVAALEGIELEGTALKIQIAAQRAERNGSDPSARPVRAVHPHSIYIGGLNFDTTTAALAEFVASFVGPDAATRIRISTDRETGRSKGFAHIDMVDDEAVEKAIAGMNGSEFLGRILKVNKAGEKPTTTSGERPAYTSNARPRAPREQCIFLGNLAFTVEENYLREMINDVVGEGSFVNVRLGVDRETGRSRGFAHVELVDAETANRAVELLNNLEVEGRPMRADISQEIPRNNEGGNRRSGGEGGYNNNRGGGGRGFSGGRGGGDRNGGGRGGGGRGGFGGRRNDGDRRQGGEGADTGNDFY